LLLRALPGVAAVTRVPVLAEEDMSAAQTRIGQRLLQGYSVTLTPTAHLVLADVVAILATEETADEPRDYAAAVLARLGRYYRLRLP
jgi:hypothetical protein